MIDFFNWYWIADDGRVFSSAQQLIVGTTDPAYVEWAATMRATPWPRDDAGVQTNAALQEVLRPHSIFVDLSYYTAHARQVRLSGDITVNGLPFSTDPITFGSLNSAYIYTQAKTGDVFSWKLPDGSFITLNKADIAALQDAANSFAQACFACEDATLTAIEGNTITTRAQVDAAFAAVPNTFTGLSSDAQKVRHRPRSGKRGP